MTCLESLGAQLANEIALPAFFDSDNFFFGKAPFCRDVIVFHGDLREDFGGLVRSAHIS